MLGGGPSIANTAPSGEQAGVVPPMRPGLRPLAIDLFCGDHP